MPKKSKLDQRIDSIFDGFHPEEIGSKPGRISRVDPVRTKLTVAKPDRQYSAEKTGSFAGGRRFLAILISFMAVCLVTGFLIYTHFNVGATDAISTANAAPAPAQIQFNPPVSTQVRPDIQAPAAPTGLTANTTNSQTVILTWTGSSDNVGVVGYTIYRNGMSIATASSSNLTFTDTATLPNTEYTYGVDAYDQAGNHSAVSAPLLVTTPAKVGSLIFFLPVADTYVNEDDPTSIYGNANTLRVDASPDVYAYLRFNVTGLGGKTIKRARLKVYTNSVATQGISVVAVKDNSWTELTANFYNAPRLEETLASSAPVANNDSWISLDLTDYITGEGSFNIGIVTGSSTSVNLASRESGDKAPQLILELSQ